MNIGELYSNGVLRGPGNRIMDPGQAGVPNTPNYVPTETTGVENDYLQGAHGRVQKRAGLPVGVLLRAARW